MELSKEVKVVQGLPAKWGACFRTVIMHTIPLSLICWKDTVAVGLGSGDIVILDGTTGNQVVTLSGHTKAVHSVAVSSDGALFVSGSWDKTIKQWDLQTGGVIKTLYGHTEGVRSVSISTDHITIASVSSDKTLRLWDIQTGKCHHIIEQKDEAQYVSFSPTDQQHLIFASDRNIQQWEIGGHGINHGYEGYNPTFSPDGTHFASYNSYPGTVVIQNSSSGAVVAEFPVVCGDNTECCCFSPDGRLIAVTPSKDIQIWDITGSDPQHIETFVGHSPIIHSVVFSSSSSLISSSSSISSSYDSSVKFWQITVPSTDNITTHSKTTSIGSALIRSITLQAEDSITISSDSNGVVKVWDLSTGICTASFQTPAKEVKQCDVRLIGNRLIFAWSADKEIYIYDVERGGLLDTMYGLLKSLIDIRISEDGSIVFCLDGDYVYALSIQTGEAVGKAPLRIVGVISLIVDGSRAWVYSPWEGIRGWDFGVTDSPPIKLVDPPSLSFSDTKQWDIGLSMIRDTVTGQVIFKMGGKYTHPVDVQLGGKYVAIRYESGEVLVLDFSNVLP